MSARRHEQMLFMLEQAEFLGQRIEQGLVDQHLAHGILARHAHRMELRITDYGLNHLLTHYADARATYLDAMERYAVPSDEPARPEPRDLQLNTAWHALGDLGRRLLRKPDAGPPDR